MSAHLSRYALKSAQAHLAQQIERCEALRNQLGFGVAAWDRQKVLDSHLGANGFGMARRIIETAEAVHEWAKPTLRCPEHAYWDYRCAEPGCPETTVEKVRSYDGLKCPTCGEDWGDA